MSPDRERLCALEAQLVATISRLDRLVQLYHQNGRSAADMVEAERIDARKGGVQLALTYVCAQLAAMPV